MRLRVNRFCYMSLRVGGLVLGWLTLLSSVRVIYSKILLFIIGETILNNNNENISFRIPEFNNDTSIINTSIALNLLNAITSSLLVLGIVKNNHKLLLPWLIVEAIVIIISSVAGSAAFISGTYLAFTQAKSLGLAVVGLVLCFLILIIAFGFAVYCWVVVLSLYDEIRNEKNKPLQNPENGLIETTQIDQKLNH